MQPTLHEDTFRTMIFIYNFFYYSAAISFAVKNIFVFKLYTFHKNMNTHIYVLGYNVSRI